MNILQMFSYPFMQRALIAGVLVSLCAALLGVPLVLKRYSMIGDGLSHVSFGALAIAVALGITPLYFSIPVVILAAFFLLRMASHPHWNSDAAIAAVSASALAIGILVQFGWEFVLAVTGIRNQSLQTLLVNSLLETNLGLPYLYLIHRAVTRRWDESLHRAG